MIWKRSMLATYRTYHMKILNNFFSTKRKLIYLKLVSAIFHHFFIFNQIIALQKIWKMYFISSESSFRSQDIQIFVFPSSPLFLPVSHCFRGWSNINLILCDINCLNNKLNNTFCLISWEGKEVWHWNFARW